MSHSLNESEARFAQAAVRRKRVFLVLSVVGIVVAALFAAYVVYRWTRDPSLDVGVRVALIILILLNARQNLRQFRYANALEKLLGPTHRSSRQS